MSVALAGTAPSTFEIKSAYLPLVALMLKSSNLERLAQEMAQRFGDMPDFFDNDPVVIDLHPLNVAEANAMPDFGALQACGTCDRRGKRFIASDGDRFEDVSIGDAAPRTSSVARPRRGTSVR